MLGSDEGVHCVWLQRQTEITDQLFQGIETPSGHFVGCDDAAPADLPLQGLEPLDIRGDDAS
jgi:hypothetical protein